VARNSTAQTLLSSTREEKRKRELLRCGSQRFSIKPSFGTRFLETSGFSSRGFFLSPSPLLGRTEKDLGVRNPNLSIPSLWGNFL
jgi:hypothetical protein